MIKDLSIVELGQLVHLLHKGGNQSEAQAYATEIRIRVAQSNLTIDGTVAVLEDRNPILDTLPKEPVLTHVSVTWAEQAKANMTEEKQAMTTAIAETIVIEPEGIVYDGDGNVLAISAQPGERGYDPDAHEKEVRILCDGVHIETAHTADTEAGTLKYYKKNDQGRIKTLQMTGKIEIKV